MSSAKAEKAAISSSINWLCTSLWTDRLPSDAPYWSAGPLAGLALVLLDESECQDIAIVQVFNTCFIINEKEGITTSDLGTILYDVCKTPGVLCKY